jgi:hypothetical protein
MWYNGSGAKLRDYCSFNPFSIMYRAYPSQAGTMLAPKQAWSPIGDLYSYNYAKKRKKNFFFFESWAVF